MNSISFKLLSTKYGPLRVGHQSEEGDFLNTTIIETTGTSFFELLFQERQTQTLSDTHMPVPALPDTPNQAVAT